MDSDDSDSELDIETSTTPDPLNDDRGSTDGRKEVKRDLSSPVASESSSGGGGGGIGGVGIGGLSAVAAAAAAAASSAAPPMMTSSITNFTPRMVVGGHHNPAAAAAAASAAMAAAAAASGGTDYASLAAKNWLKAGGATDPSLHSFFMPFSAAAAAAAAHHLPFPHHFNSQASLFHVKDSVWLSDPPLPIIIIIIIIIYYIRAYPLLILFFISLPLSPPPCTPPWECWNMLLLTTNNTSKYVKQTYKFPKYEGLKKELQSIYINKNLPKSLKKDKKILISNTTCRLKMMLLLITYIL